MATKAAREKPPTVEIEVNQDLEFQRKEWRVQRIGWLVILAVIVAALLGAFGRGPLAHGEVTDAASGLRLEYERIARHESPSELVFHIRAGTVTTNDVRIWLSRSYADGLEIERISPEPESESVTDDRVTYSFLLDDPRREARVTFNLTPDAMGRRQASAGIVNGPTLRFAQFVLP